jgi:penicillin amidase
MDHDHKGRPRAIRWVAHDPAGVNLGLMRIESAKTLEESLELANLSGSPHQNFVIADDRGRIAWTILGRIPRRVGFDGRLPTSWADGSRRWDGYLKPEEYPRIIDPESGKLWTANARVVSGQMLATLGDGGYDLGARAQQIRDDLLATETASEADMLRIQLDDRAVFLERWRQLLLDTLTSDALAVDPRRKELRERVDDWGGHASVDSVGFRAVREFRLRLIAQLSDVLVAPCKKAEPGFTIAKLDRTEGPVWRLVSERPEHLIDPRYENWDALLLAAADEVIANATKNGGRVGQYTWGKYNTTTIRHPLSLAVPQLSPWLDMPARALAGDAENMPRIQAPQTGASQRLAVSPGHEDEGYFHMPCGQSGHPMSPHYGDAHSAWEEGRPSSFLPGEAVHTLVLKPAA